MYSGIKIDTGTIYIMLGKSVDSNYIASVTTVISADNKILIIDNNKNYSLQYCSSSSCCTCYITII